MDSFIYEYPTKVYLGEGLVSKELKNAAKVLGNKVLITYGGSSAKKNGTLDEVLSILKKEGIDTVEFSGIMPNPTYRKVLDGAELARKENVSGILALGGGSVIDASKIIALQSVNECDVWAAEIDKRGALDHRPLPLGAIVTSSGTGSEMNAATVWRSAVAAFFPVL